MSTGDNVKDPAAGDAPPFVDPAVDAGNIGDATPPPVASRRSAAPSKRGRKIAVSLGALAAFCALVIAGTLVGTSVLYQHFYSPTAYVVRYLDLLEQGRAADALLLPGVDVATADFEAAGLSPGASDALLRSAALGPISDITPISEVTDGDVTTVVVSYTTAGHEASSTFKIERDGSIGAAPTWRFATSPLAMIDITVDGAMEFSVNGFTVDKRQVSVDGADADPLDALPMVVFSPGLYSVSVDSTLSETPGVAVLADVPMKEVPVSIEAEPTAQFISTVQERVNEFLLSCTEQQVLQPTGCPFGYFVENRIVDLPTWSIVHPPTIDIEPDGAHWVIPDTKAIAHLEVTIRSLFDGSTYALSEDVPFTVNGTITVNTDESVSIEVGGTPTS